MTKPYKIVAKAIIFHEGHVLILRKSLEERLANYAKLEEYFCENAMCIILGWDAHYVVTAEGAAGYYLMDGGRLNIALPALSWNVIRLEPAK